MQIFKPLSCSYSLFPLSLSLFHTCIEHYILKLKNRILQIRETSPKSNLLCISHRQLFGSVSSVIICNCGQHLNDSLNIILKDCHIQRQVDALQKRNLHFLSEV